jgi:alkylation response protein AidB-like acyl-CoA dehydrogenase
VVDRLVDSLADSAPQRDLLGGSPKAQRDDIRASGLLALSIPTELGGLGGNWQDTLHVVRRLARVDSSVAHLFAFHHLMLATVQLYGQPAQWERWFRHTARQDWFWGNALNPRDRRATCQRFDGGVLLSGPKSFCSGAQDSEMLVVSGDEQGELLIAAVPTSRSGIHVIQDWDNMGQRQTDSGSVEFDRLRIDDADVLSDPGPLSTPRSCLRSLISQLILVNIYVGIAEGAFEDARRYTLREARPWHASSFERVEDDPHVLTQFGEFHVSLEALRLLGDRAGRQLDEALARGDDLTAEERGQLALSIATAKVAATRSGLDICNRLFDVTGARSTHAALGLDRHWRNLRTHTLHDPVHYKTHELGEWVLKGALPQPGFYS